MGIGGALLFLRMGPVMGEGWRATGIGAGELWKMTRAAQSGDYGTLTQAGGASGFPAAAGGDVSVELERLNSLRKEGAISDAEYEQLRSTPSIGYELRAMSPVSVITHVLAIAAGVWGGSG